MELHQSAKAIGLLLLLLLLLLALQRVLLLLPPPLLLLVAVEMATRMMGRVMARARARVLARVLLLAPPLVWKVIRSALSSVWNPRRQAGSPSTSSMRSPSPFLHPASSHAAAAAAAAAIAGRWSLSSGSAARSLSTMASPDEAWPSWTLFSGGMVRTASCYAPLLWRLTVGTDSELRTIMRAISLLPMQPKTVTVAFQLLAEAERFLLLISLVAASGRQKQPVALFPLTPGALGPTRKKVVPSVLTFSSMVDVCIRNSNISKAFNGTSPSPPHSGGPIQLSHARTHARSCGAHAADEGDS